MFLSIPQLSCAVVGHKLTNNTKVAWDEIKISFRFLAFNPCLVYIIAP